MYDKQRKYLYTEQTLQEVCLGINSMCVGAESRYFNGYTNITDDAFLVFGVKGLMDTNKRLKDDLYKGLIEMNERQHIADEEYFQKYIKAHLDRGAKLLYSEFKYNPDLLLALVSTKQSI